MTKTMFRRLMKISCIVAASMCLIGCSLLSPIKSPDPYRYAVNKMPLDLPHYQKHRRIIMVMPPDSRPAFNTTGMAYTQWPYQIAYFAQNEWIETPPQMLQPLIVRSLQATNYYRAVVNTSYAGLYDYVLYTQILTFKDDFTIRPAIFDLLVRAQLLRVSTNRIIATKIFDIEEPLAYITPYSGVRAANRASAELMRRLTRFAIRNSR